MADGVFRRCSCGKRVPEGQRTCPREGCTGTVRWAYVIDVARRPRKQMHRSGFGTKAEAAAGRAAALAELGAGTYVAPSKLTLGAYLDQWLAQSATLGWSANTRRIRETAVIHAKARLADVPLQDLTRDHFRDFFGWLLAAGRLRDGGPLKARSVQSIYGSLRLALRPAVEDKKIRANVVVGTFRVPKDGGGEERQTWALDEMRTFLASAAGHRDAGLWAAALATGMRRGELLGLRWRDVDLDGGRVNVRRQWTRAGNKGWSMEALKTGSKALRTIELDRYTVAIFQRQRAMVVGEREAWRSAYTSKDLVFPREDGRPQNGSEVTNRFKRAIARCRPGVPMMVFHGTRHTHATLLLEDGVSLKVVAQRLGDHENTVLQTYGHVLPRGMAIAASCVASWMEPERGAARGAVSDELALLRDQVRDLQARLAAYEVPGPNAEIREQSVSEAPSDAVADVEMASVSN